MPKIGFEMQEEERALKIIDVVADIAVAQFTEGFINSVLTEDEANQLTDHLCEAGAITRKALERYEEEQEW